MSLAREIETEADSSPARQKDRRALWRISAAKSKVPFDVLEQITIHVRRIGKAVQAAGAREAVDSIDRAIKGPIAR